MSLLEANTDTVWPDVDIIIGAPLESDDMSLTPIAWYTTHKGEEYGHGSFVRTVDLDRIRDRVEQMLMDHAILWMGIVEEDDGETEES